MAVDVLPSPNYVVAFPPQILFRDKTTGAPLSSGTVSFYQDTARTTLKPIYKQVQQPDNSYLFVEISNPVTLTGIGTFGDDLGNDILIYTYPYTGTPNDEDRGTVELYYIVVRDSGGVLQFTREAYPPNISSSTNPTDTFESSDNELANPQFAEVLFTPTTGYTFYVTGTDAETAISPDWSIITTGVGTVTVAQVAISDPSVISNPPYYIDINSTGAALTEIKLRQRLTASPRLFNGNFVSAYFLAKSIIAGASLEMRYKPSSSTPTYISLITGQTTTAFTEFKATVDISFTSASTATAPTGYVDIEIVLQPLLHIQVTSAQLVNVQNLSSSVPFLQQSTARQIDHLFHYYKQKLADKPIPSYLVAWDFPLNPAQFATAANRVVAATAIGANKSKYVWDQTIVFQSANSGVSVASGNSSELLLTAAATTQMAIVQYLDSKQARKLLNGSMCVNVAAKASVATTATVSLWYTTDATLPVITTGTNNSIVATLRADSTVATNNGTWTRVPRALAGIDANGESGNATFTIETNATNVQFNDYDFNGWSLAAADILDANSAIFFAIVISTGSVPITNHVDIYSVGLYSGDIATRPAPQTTDEVLRECQYYYETSYLPGVVVPSITSANGIEGGVIIKPVSFTSGANTFNASSFTDNFISVKRAAPTMTYYSGQSTTPATVGYVAYFASAQAVKTEITMGTYYASTQSTTKNYGFIAGGTASTLTGGNALESAFTAHHFAADARLGVV